MPTTTITTTDAARHLGEYLARVKHKGEHFLLTKNDQLIAELSPASGSRRATWGELLTAVGRLPRDPWFADDLEKVNEADQPAPKAGLVACGVGLKGQSLNDSSPREI